ncbi:MAG: CHAT domain-containing protein [Deltaproteobacteria bacterium]|nr:CHAT domain-containing protein [Deltaproteobacteria bacterium]
MRVWAWAAPGADLQLRAFPLGEPVVGEANAGGRLFRVSASQLERLEVSASGGGATAKFVLPVQQWPLPDVFRKAREIGRSGQLKEARLLVEQHLVGASSEDRWYGRALGLLARIEQRSGHPVKARELLRQAISEHQQKGDVGEEIADRCLLIHISYSDLGDFRTALQELQEMPLPPVGDADAAYRQAYYRGTLALYNGDLRNALLFLNRAQEQREHLADAAGLGAISQILGRVLQRLGRGEEARELFDRLTSDAGYLEQLNGCQRATLFNNVGWDRILKLEAGSPAEGTPVEPSPAEDPLPLLEEALEALAAGPSCQTVGRASIQINLGFARFHRGDLEAAEEHLEKARADLGNASPRLLLWHLDLQSRLDERRGRLERAADGFSRLQELAVVALSPEAEWRALFGQARVAEAAGRSQEALRAYASAEGLLDDISLRSPVGLGRATSMVAVEGSTRSYLPLLLDLGLRQEAFQAARRSRSRVLRGLVFKERVAGLDPEERLQWSRSLARYEALAAELDASLGDAWRQAGSQRKGGELLRRQRSEELRQALDQSFALLDAKGLAKVEGALVPGEGEVILLYHPVVGGWVGFALDLDFDSGSTGDIQVARLGPLPRELPSEELAVRLLGPFRKRLATAQQVRIYSHGWLRGVDFHALPVDGAPLLAQASVVYGLDLGEDALEEDASVPPAFQRQALVVTDPTETLPAAGREASTVTSRLHQRALAVSWLTGGASTRRQVLVDLEGASVFHFSGHADFGDGLGGALRLADSGKLSVGDVLASPSLPASVVLAACDTGRPGRGVSGPALSLAEAFLVGGSREVLSSSRAVDDQAAAAMVGALYRHWQGDLSLAEALRRAQLEPEIRQGTDWAAFRVLER